MSSDANPEATSASVASIETIKEPTPENNEENKASTSSGPLEVPSGHKSSKGHSRKPSSSSSSKESGKDKEKVSNSTGSSDKTSNKEENTSASAKKKEKAAKRDEESEEDEEESSEEDSRVETKYFDMSHPSRFWNRIEAGLRDGANPSEHLAHGISGLTSAVAGELSKDHLKHIIDTGLYSCAVAILNRQYFPPDFRNKANEFLMKCMDFCVKYLTKDGETAMELARVMFRIFLHHFQYSSFYEKPPYKEELPEEWKKKYWPASDEEPAQNAEGSPVWARMPKSEKDTSPLYVINTNYFHSIGGFDLVVKQLGASSSLFETKLLLKVPYAVRIFVYPSILRSYSKDIMKVLFKVLLSYAGKNLRAEDRTHLDEAKDTYLAKMLEQVFPEEETQQFLITYSLEIIRKLLQADTLEKRLKALKELKKVIERTKKLEEKKFGAAIAGFIRNAAMGPDEQQSAAPLPRIDAKFVLAWSIANGVMDRYFDILPSHIEILRQGMDFIIFLAQQREYQDEHTDILINNSISMHEHDKRILCSSVTALAPHLDAEHFDHLFSKVTGLSLKDYDVYLLELVMSLTAIATKQNSNLKHDGFLLMWKLIQEEANAPFTVASKAFSYLVSLLGGKDGESQRQQFLDLALDNFSKMESIPQSLELIQRIVDMYPVKRRKKIIEVADERIRGPKSSTAAPAGLIPLALMETVTYKKAATATFQGAEQPKSEPEGNGKGEKKDKKKSRKEKEKEHVESKETVVVARVIDAATMPVGKSRIAHLEQVKLRLRFLEYILCNSALAISPDGVDVLWDCLITQSLCTSERELAFAFLEKPSLNADGYPILPESVLQHIFSNKMLKMDGSQLSMAGYRLFERYFVTLNERNGKVKRIQPSNVATETDGPSTQVSSSLSVAALASDLIGFDNLWDIALSSEDPRVADVAVEFLNNLHAPLEAAGVTKAKALKLRDDYVKASVEQLNQAATKKNSQRLERCFILLRNFVLDFEVRLQTSAQPGTQAANQLLKKKVLPSQSASSTATATGMPTSKIWLKSASKPSQRLVLNPSSVTVRAFREKAMEMFGFDNSDALQFLVDDEKDKELKDLDKLLSDYKVVDQTSVYIKKVDSIAMVEEGQNGQTSVAAGAPELSISNLMMDSIPFVFGGAGVLADAFKAMAKRGLSQTATSDAIAETRSGSAKTITSTAVQSSIAFNPLPAVVLRPLNVPLKMDLKRVESHPARILSSQQYFDKCYSLLSAPDADENMCRQIWELLSLLPRNDLLVKQIEDAAKASNVGVDAVPPADSAFSQLFDVKSHYQLTYNLQLVEAIISREAEPVVVGSESWRDTFASAGLVSLALKQLTELGDAHSWTIASKRLAAQIMRIVVLLVLDRDPAKTQTTETVNFEGFKLRSQFASSTKLQIITNIMNIIQISALRGSSVFVPQDQGAEQDLDTLVAQEAFTLLVPLISSSAANLQVFCRHTDLQDWIISVLLKAPQNSTRENASRALSAILSRASSLAIDIAPPKRQKSSKKVVEESTEEFVEPDGAFFLSLLLPAVETDEIENYADVCDQYFTVLETLFSVHSTGIQMSSLVRKFGKKIIRHPIVEQHATAGVEDKVLIGLMKLVLAIVKQDPDLKESCGKLLIREIMHEALFAIPTAETHHQTNKNSSISPSLKDPPKCKTRAARRMAFSLLAELARDCPRNFKSICDALLAQAESIDMQNEYNFSPSSKEKSLCGYLGLQNQGATCYMNSLMQQLFCIPEFRQGILLARESDEVVAADIAAAEKAAARATSEDKAKSEAAPVQLSSSGLPVKDNILYQMQRMFAFLQESEKRFFDTKDFCGAYKDPDGKPINTSQQMDANEYFQRLFDLIEKRLKGSNQEDILQRVFGGGLSNQLIPTECSHRREREEPFFNIGVEIKNKSDLRESLQLFVEGELLTGDNKYNCEVCQKPVETLKRCCIDKLPPVLVVQLKRFEFDYEKMRNEKLNTACSFPMELDMEPYTKEGLARREAERGMGPAPSESDVKPPSYYQYELSGIVVHTGSADFGHYYSYIRERVPQFGAKERRWFEFNDTVVAPFDPKKIPMECFGGEEEIIEWTDLARTQKRKVKRQKPYNAYILFYERKGISQPQLSLEQIRMLAPQPSALSEVRDGRLNQHKRTYSADDLKESANSDSKRDDVNHADAGDKGSKAHRRSTSVDIRLSSDKPIESADEKPISTQASSPKKLEVDEDSSSEEAPREGPPTRVSSNDSESVDATKANLRRSALRRSRRNAENGDEDDASLDRNTTLVAERIEGRNTSSLSVMKNFNVGARAAMFVAKLAVASRKRKQQAAGTLALASGISLEELDLLQLGSGQRLTGRRCEVSPDILNSIWEDNSMFLIRKQLFDPDYFSFVWQISNSYAPPASKSKLIKKRQPSDAIAADTSLSLRRLLPSGIQFDLAGEVDKDRAVAAAAAAQAQAAREAASQTVMGGLSSMASSIFGSSSSSSGGAGSSSGVIPGTSSKDKIKVDYKGDRAKEEAVVAKERQKQIEKEKAEREKREKEKEKERAAGLEDIPADPKEKKDPKKEKEKEAEKEKEKDDKAKDKEKDKEKKDKKKEKESGGIDDNWTDIGEDGKKSSSKKDKEAKDSSKSSSNKDKVAKTEAVSPSDSPSTGHKKKKSNSEKPIVVDTPPQTRGEDYDPVMHNVEMGTRFVLQILSHARDRPMLPYWISSLTRMLHSSPKASRWFLESLIYDAEQLKNILLACPAEKIRQASAKLIFAAIETLAEDEYTKYTQTAKLLAQGPLTDPPAPSTVVWFMDKLLTTMIRMAKRKSSLNVDYLFWVIAQFARLGVHERHYLMKQGVLVTLTDFARHYADRATPITRYNSPAQQHLSWLLDSIATILLSCKMSPDTSSEQPPSSMLGEKHSLNLPDGDYEASFAKTFLYTMMREEVNIDAMGAILYHSCWENAAMSKFVLGIIQDGLIRMNWTAYNGFLNMFAVVTCIDDSIADDRVEIAIDKFLVGMKDAAKSTNRRAIEKLIAFMIKLSNNCEIFRRKILRRRTAVNEILSVAGYRLSAV